MQYDFILCSSRTFDICYILCGIGVSVYLFICEPLICLFNAAQKQHIPTISFHVHFTLLQQRQSTQKRVYMCVVYGNTYTYQTHTHKVTIFTHMYLNSLCTRRTYSFIRFSLAFSFCVM